MADAGDLAVLAFVVVTIATWLAVICALDGR